MKTKSIVTFTARNPFRPFSVRLANGKAYSFNETRDLGVTKDNNTLVYYDNDGGLVLIDVASINEIIDVPKK